MKHASITALMVVTFSGCADMIPRPMTTVRGYMRSVEVGDNRGTTWESARIEIDDSVLWVDFNRNSVSLDTLSNHTDKLVILQIQGNVLKSCDTWEPRREEEVNKAYERILERAD